MPGLTILVSRMLVGGLKYYRACFLATLPALLALVIPLQLGVLLLSRGGNSPAERLMAALLGIQLTVLGLVISYALLPQAVAALRARPARPVPLPKEFVRRALMASSLLLLGIGLRFEPTVYFLPALSAVALFWAIWPCLKRQAILGEHMFKKATRRWWRSRLAEKLTVFIALALAQAGIIAVGQAVIVASGAMGGPMVSRTSQVFLAAGLLPFYLLTLGILGANLPPVRGRARFSSGLQPATSVKT